jgi:hypothetical protein
MRLELSERQYSGLLTYRTTIEVVRTMSSNVCVVERGRQQKVGVAEWDIDEAVVTVAHVRNDETLLADIFVSMCESAELFSNDDRDGYVSLGGRLVLRARGEIGAVDLPACPEYLDSTTHLTHLWNRPDVRRLLRIFVKNSCC